MPLIKSSSKKAMNYNLHELMHGKIGKSRAKAINTIAKKMGISKQLARQHQAVAIAMSLKKK